jgi:transposase-like protein
MKILKIHAEENCSGPGIYRIFYQCSNCGVKNNFIRHASLLTSQNFNCPACNHTLHYTYDPSYLEQAKEHVKDLVNLSLLLDQTIKTCNYEELNELGMNFYFAVNAHLSNVLNAKYHEI